MLESQRFSIYHYEINCKVTKYNALIFYALNKKFTP